MTIDKKVLRSVSRAPIVERGSLDGSCPVIDRRQVPS